MRWMCWVSTILLVGRMIGVAAACDCDKNRTVLPAVAPASFAVLSSDVCCAPGGYVTVPGCCEELRPCCANAWAGFCVRKSMKHDACRGCAGIPRGVWHGGVWYESDGFRSSNCCNSGGVSNADEPTTIQPAPTSPTPTPTPAPVPAPEKSGQRPRTTFSYVK